MKHHMPEVKERCSVYTIAGSSLKVGKRNQGVHIPAKSLQVICTLSLLLTPAMTDLAENILCWKHNFSSSHHSQA